MITRMTTDNDNNNKGEATAKKDFRLGLTLK